MIKKRLLLVCILILLPVLFFCRPAVVFGEEAGYLDLSERDAELQFECGERIKLRVTYMGLTAGYLEINTVESMLEGRPVLRLELDAYTSGAVSWMYSVRDTLVSYMDVRGLFSWGYDYHQDHNGEEETEKVRYQQEEGFVIRNGEKDGAIPPFTQDILSAVYYLRGKDLQEGQEYSFPVHYEDEVFNLILEVEKLEKIVTDEGWQEAFKLTPRLEDDEREEEIREQLKDSGPGVRAWISNDERRIPLQIQIPAYFGSLYGYLDSYEPGKSKND